MAAHRSSRRQLHWCKYGCSLLIFQPTTAQLFKRPSSGFCGPTIPASNTLNAAAQDAGQLAPFCGFVMIIVQSWGYGSSRV